MGVPRSTRGKVADDTLQFFNDCFDNDVVTVNGQEFLFRPRPARPPIYIGGSAANAIERTLKYGDGWLPMGSLDKLLPDIKAFKSKAVDQGHPGEVVTFATLSPSDELANHKVIEDYERAGVTRMIVGKPYQTADDWYSTIAVSYTHLTLPTKA